MLVYRVENSSGFGMYCGSSSGASSEMSEDMRHPMPTQDPLLKHIWERFYFEGRQRFFSFAFSTPEQLKFWIYKTEWREELAQEGFSVYVYDSDEAYYGDTQAVFRKDKSTIVKNISLRDI